MIKEQERAELHRAIWQIANDLRGSVDGWDFKQYVLHDINYKNKLTEENRAKILKILTARKDADHFAKLVDNKTI